MFTAALATATRIFPMVARALVIVAALAAPVMAVPLINGGQGTTIEAPPLKKTGAGFVLMVSLQRG